MPTDPAQVRARYTRLKPIREIKTEQRGWTLDVLNIVRRLVEERGVHAVSSSKPPATLKRTEVRAPSELASQARYKMDALNQEFASRNVVTTAEVYVFERELKQLHPDNPDKTRAGRHVRDNPVN